MYNRFMKLRQYVVPYALNSQKRVTHSTIKVLHQPTSSECVPTFPCSLPRACPNDNKGQLQKFAITWTTEMREVFVLTNLMFNFVKNEWIFFSNFLLKYILKRNSNLFLKVKSRNPIIRWSRKILYNVTAFEV